MKVHTTPAIARGVQNQTTLANFRELKLLINELMRYVSSCSKAPQFNSKYLVCLEILKKRPQYSPLISFDDDLNKEIWSFH